MHALYTHKDCEVKEGGLVAAEVTALPAQKKSLYNYQRKFKVFVRKI